MFFLKNTFIYLVLEETMTTWCFKWILERRACTWVKLVLGWQRYGEKTYYAWSIIFFYNSTKRNKIVSLQENYSPLKVEADIVQTMQTGHYKLTKAGEQWTIFWAPLEDNKPKSLDDENWERLFSFRLGECQLGDYEEASKYEWHLM